MGTAIKLIMGQATLLDQLMAIFAVTLFFFDQLTR